MKKIHLLLLKSFIRPFLVTFLIVMFVLLMLFLFKYIDDLIGKGFEWYVILELMIYASATNVQMALPLSVLLSSIMTYGSLGENYELVAIKSAGISLRRALMPMFLVVFLLSVAAFVFSDYMLPKANLKYYSLLYDARQQKSANFLPQGVFSNTFPGYSIRVNRKDPDGQTLYDIMIYEKNPSGNNLIVTLAKEGKMYRTPSGQFLVLKLKGVVRYQEEPGKNSFNIRQTLTRERFKETEQKIDISSLKLRRTDESEFKGAYQMMNLKQLKESQKLSKHQLDSSTNTNFKMLNVYLKYFSMPLKHKNGLKYNPVNLIELNKLKDFEKVNILINALSEARSIHELVKGRVEKDEELFKEIQKAALEYQKKFTFSAACLALFLIGAPLGAPIACQRKSLTPITNTYHTLICLVLKRFLSW